MRSIIVAIMLLCAVSVRADDKLDGVRAELADRASRSATTSSQGATDIEPLKNNGYRMIQGLALCIALFLVGVHLYRRFNRSTGRFGPVRHSELKLIERLALSRTVVLNLVEVRGQRMLVATGSEQVAIANLKPDLNDFATMLEEGQPQAVMNGVGGSARE